MLRLTDAWTWDFWLADDGRSYHLFFLTAPRSLGDPELRHRHATIGHAVSPDLRDWTVLPAALAPCAAPAFDDIATWTGSVIPGPAGGPWHLFYTGIGSAEQGRKQRIGLATSTDLTHWDKQPAVAFESDPRWYEQLTGRSRYDEAWRDPWILPDPAGDGWHMLLTARSSHGPLDQRGVIGHARSADLRHWRAEQPLSAPGTGFGHLEVPQAEIVDGRHVLIFSCQADYLSGRRRAAWGTGGIWCVPCDSLLGPFDTARATLIADESLYSGRLVRDRRGDWQLLAFRNLAPDGHFSGELTDPLPITWTPDGTTLVIPAPPGPTAT
jgi:beta-fructofuranosidase